MKKKRGNYFALFAFPEIIKKFLIRNENTKNFFPFNFFCNCN